MIVLPTLDEWISSLKQEMYDALKIDDFDKAKKCARTIHALESHKQPTNRSEKQ